MRLIPAVCLLGFSALSALAAETESTYLHPATTDPGFVAETDRFRFYENYWLNLHHWLYNAALADQAGEALPGTDSTGADWNEKDRAQLNAALSFYQAEVLPHDLRISYFNHGFKRWVIAQPDTPLTSPPDAYTALVEVLNQIAPVYTSHLWPTHHAANQAVLADNLALLRQVENEAVTQLEQLCRSTWQSEKIRVDLCYHSKRDRPYTTAIPVTHIVMDTSRSATPAGNWVELVLHESAHHLINAGTGFVSGTIADISRQRNQRPPRELWHSYLFYLSGRVAQDLFRKTLPDYELYMVRNGVFSRRFSLLDRELGAYYRGDQTLATTTENVFAAYAPAP